MTMMREMLQTPHRLQQVLGQRALGLIAANLRAADSHTLAFQLSGPAYSIIVAHSATVQPYWSAAKLLTTSYAVPTFEFALFQVTLPAVQGAAVPSHHPQQAQGCMLA